MSELVCPFCGPRALGEFEFRKTVAESPGAGWAEPGSAEPGSPEPSGGASHQSFARIYMRLEQPDLSLEHWQHSAGCRAWLEVRRNPATGAILNVYLLEAP